MLDNILIIYYYVILSRSIMVLAYTNSFFKISKLSDSRKHDICYSYENNTKFNNYNVKEEKIIKFNLTSFPKFSDEDPYRIYENTLYTFLIGESDDDTPETEDEKSYAKVETIPEKETLFHYPSGIALRKAELFQNKPSVHLPMSDMVQVGYCQLRMTEDLMQTAVDAFGIFIYGNLEDITRIPADYLLRSARTLAMMKISNEKLAVTWQVVKGNLNSIDVTYETLEQYRPLFKYLNGKEIGRLNLLDNRILRYIGTHPDLNRHQVGVVASKYIKLNKQWSEPKYLNLMNNLICGVPMTFMRKIPENTFLQLSHQVFYHTRACDPLQRRFYLVMMTKTQALGKAYSWNAHDVSRLGLLLAEVEGRDLSSIKPEALAGLTAQVMVAMKPENLRYLTKFQIRNIGDKALNIMAKKLKEFQDLNSFNGCIHRISHKYVTIFRIITIYLVCTLCN